MRSFTIKNVSSTDPDIVVLLTRINIANQNIVDLRAALSIPHPPGAVAAGVNAQLARNVLAQANIDLVNLMANANVANLNDNDLIVHDNVKNNFAAAANTAYVTGYNGIVFPNPGDPVTVLNLYPNIGPLSAAINGVLSTNGNLLDIVTVAPNVPAQSVTNLARLAALKRLLRAAKIRSSYIDGLTAYGNSKPYLIKSCGLYCAFCESALSDGIVADVEHKLPKGIFNQNVADAERNWVNFVLACKSCNTSCKGVKFVDTRVKVFNQIPLPHSVISFGGVNYVMPAAPNDVQVTCRIANGSVVDPKRATRVPPGVANPSYPFTVGNMPGGAVATYGLIMQAAKDNTVWADIRNNNQLSFHIYDYRLNNGVNAAGGGGFLNLTLNNFDLSMRLQVQPVGNAQDYTINLVNFNGIMLQANIALQSNFNDNVNPSNPASVANNASVDSAQNTIDLCGLNRIASDERFTDQRRLRRTKAWLHAMKQLKLLQQYHHASRDLRDYYNQQLDPVNIQANPGNGNFIAGLRDATPAAIGLTLNAAGDCTFTFNQVLPDGAVDIAFAAGAGVGGTVTQWDGAGPGSQMTDYRLTGNIVNHAGNRTMTGMLSITTAANQVGGGGGVGNFNLNGRVFCFNNSQVTLPGGIQTLTVPQNQGVVSNSNIPATVGVLETWGQNKDKLIAHLNKTDKLLVAYLLENIEDMVRVGGFYSTWVRTFQRVCIAQGGNFPRFDIDLVRRLDIKAQENEGDPFQFHGTDAAEIITNLG